MRRISDPAELYRPNPVHYPLNHAKPSPPPQRGQDQRFASPPQPVEPDGHRVSKELRTGVSKRPPVPPNPTSLPPAPIFPPGPYQSISYGHSYSRRLPSPCATVHVSSRINNIFTLNFQ